MTNSVLYLSSNTSAPTWATGSNSLIPVLDACLVNGYGSKPAAGWTKVYTGTNKAVYRSGATGIRHYLRVDCGSVTSYGLMRAYETMSDVDTGTNPYPTVVQSANGIGLPVSTNAHGWAVVANDRAFWVFGYGPSLAADVTPGFTPQANTSAASFGFGRFTSLLGADDYNHFIAGGFLFGGGASRFSRTTDLTMGVGNSEPAGFLARDYSGVNKSFVYAKHYLGAQHSIGMSGPIVPDTVTGGLVVQDKVTILENQAGLGVIRRGYLPGLMLPIGRLHSPSRALYTFGGAGALSGRTFTVVPMMTSDESSSAINFQSLVFEIGVDWGN